MQDFSHIFEPGEAKRRTAPYYAAVCGKCKGMCCSYNTSPIHHDYSLASNMGDDNLIILRKALFLHEEYRKRFFSNVRQALAYHEEKGFGRDLVSFVKKHRYSLKSIVKAFMHVDWKINAHNRAVYDKDPYDMNCEVVNDCILLIPGKGCVMEEYKPFVCVTAFRNCFPQLKLYDYVDANTFETSAQDLQNYIRADLELNSDVLLPKFIIGADWSLKRTLINMVPERKHASFDKLSYFQTAKLADFVVMPFSVIPPCLEGMIPKNRFYFTEKVKDPPPVIFIDEIYTGKMDTNFDFGLDYVQMFKVSSNNNP